MKIHKINLENYYRNLMFDTIQMRNGKSYNHQPTYSDIVVNANDDGTVVLALPVIPASKIFTPTPTAIPATTFITYATATIVGYESTKSIPLTGGFSLGLDKENAWWVPTSSSPTLNLFTIPANVDKVKVVISFKSYYQKTERVGGRPKTVTKYLVSNDSIEATTIIVQRKDTFTTSPVSVLDVDSVEMNNLVARVEALEEAASTTSNG